MKIKIKKQYRNSDDNLLPLVNIIFLLLIFFMLAGVIAKQKELHDVNLASATIDNYTEKGRNILFLKSNGIIYLNDDIVDNEALKNKIMKLKDKSLIIAADASVNSGNLDKVLLILSKTKINNITLLTNSNE